MKRLFLTSALFLPLIAAGNVSVAEPYARERSGDAAASALADVAPAAGGDAVAVDGGDAVPVPASVPVTGSWDYSAGPQGPSGWGELSPEYAACKGGKKQSPVNIVKFYQESHLPDIEPRYSAVPLSLINAGHTLQFNYAPGSGFVIDGMGYKLKRFVFRAPSEHLMDGGANPMEIQFVHQADDGEYAIIAVMVREGAHNKFVEALWQNVPFYNGARKTVSSVKLSASDLMPRDLDYYRYEGSLTVPPCTEGVEWMILKEPIEISAEQIKAFRKMFPANARPVQALGERIVTGD